MTNYISFHNFLKSITNISQSDFDISSGYFKPVELSKGDLWIKKGKICRDIAFINEGLLKTFTTNSIGEEIATCFCGLNRMTTALESFISQTPSDISIQSLDKTELVLISHSDLQKLYKILPIWQEISRILIEKEYLSLYRYANSLNAETAKEKYLRLIEEQPVVLQKAPVQDIASYLGVSRETLSRIRNQIAKSIL